MKKTISVAKQVLDRFEKSNIPYCIARNYQFLLENRIYEGKDIDVVVLSKDMHKIDVILKKDGFGVVPINPYSMHAGYAKYIAEDEKVLQFHFHIDGVTGRHVRYLDAYDILQRRIRNEFFNAPSDEDLFLVIFLHNVLDLDKLKENDKDQLYHLLRRSSLDKEYITRKLRKLFSQKQTEHILDLVSKKQFSQLEAVMPELKNRFESRRLFKIVKVYICGVLWKIPYLFKNAPLISLIGMDGAGKTTMAEQLKKIFEKNNIRHAVVYTGRGRYNILPIQLFGKPYKKLEGTFEKKMPRKVSSWKKIIYSIAAPVFALDLFLRYFFIILPKRKTKRIVVTDRYSTDILLMANVPMPLKKFLYSFFPKPTMTVYLWNTPEILHKRKPDHPLEDLKRQEEIYSMILPLLHPLKVKSIELNKTQDTILKELSKMNCLYSL